MDILTKVRTEFELEKRPDEIVLKEIGIHTITLGDICRYVAREIAKEYSFRQKKLQEEYDSLG